MNLKKHDSRRTAQGARVKSKFALPEHDGLIFRTQLTSVSLADSFTIMMDQIRAASKKKILFLPHAVRQMLRSSRLISTREVRQVIEKGSIIEDYPDDLRGSSCLMLGFGEEGRPIHVVCAPREDYLAVITAYIPDPGEWSNDFKRRTKP